MILGSWRLWRPVGDADKLATVEWHPALALELAKEPNALPSTPWSSGDIDGLLKIKKNVQFILYINTEEEVSADAKSMVTSSTSVTTSSTGFVSISPPHSLAFCCLSDGH